MKNDNLSLIESQSYAAVKEIIEAARLSAGDLFVVGCSSSEVLGHKIGTDTNVDVAGALFSGITRALNEKNIALAAQCCEHLNRALVVDRATMEKYDLEQVNAIPQPNHAGGAFATVAYEKMQDPVLVEDIHSKASAGIDIGGTLIGMHIHRSLFRCASPLKRSVKLISSAQEDARNMSVVPVPSMMRTYIDLM